MYKHELTTPTDTTIKVVRMFDCSKELLWKIYTDPELIPQWWGPRAYETTVDKYEFKVGGEWRFKQKDKDGNEWAFHGVFKEIKPIDTATQTFVFEPMPDKQSVDKMILEEVDGKTRFTTISTFDSKEDRDGMIASGMEGGMAEGLERVDEMIVKLK